MLVPLFEKDIKAVGAWGGLKSYRSLLDAPQFYIPHDVLMPGVFKAGDIPDLLAAFNQKTADRIFVAETFGPSNRLKDSTAFAGPTFVHSS